MKHIALIPGGFDPVTVGHMDIVSRAANMFDEVYVVIFKNTAKKYMFPIDVRYKMLKLSCDALGNERIKVDVSGSLLADYAIELGASALVKGVRSFIDFDYEFQLSLINRSIDRRIETIFLPTKHEHQYISSTFVRELILYNKPLFGNIPPEIIPIIEEFMRNSNI